MLGKVKKKGEKIVIFLWLYSRKYQNFIDLYREYDELDRCVKQRINIAARDADLSFICYQLMI